MSADETAKTADLGGRLPLLDSRELSPIQKQFYERVDSTLINWATQSGFVGKTSEGKFIGPFNAFLYSPAIGDAFLKFLSAEVNTTTIDKRTREVVILSVGAVWKSGYEIYAHSAVAHSVGLSPAAIQALVAGDRSDDLTPNELIAQQFARRLTIEHRVSDDLYRQAVQAFGREGLVEMIHLIGIYLLTCAILNGFEVPVP